MYIGRNTFPVKTFHVVERERFAPAWKFSDSPWEACAPCRQEPLLLAI